MDNFFTQMLNAQTHAKLTRVNGNFHVYHRGAPNPFLYDKYEHNGREYAISKSSQPQGMYNLYENGKINKALLTNLIDNAIINQCKMKTSTPRKKAQAAQYLGLTPDTRAWVGASYQFPRKRAEILR